MRNIALLSVLVVSLLPACGLGGTPVKSGVLRYGENFNVDARDVPMLMALDDLAAQGYTIERVDLSSSDLIGEALARGTIDMTAANALTIWSAIGQGAEARTIMQKFGSTLTLLATQEIQACADLEGKAIGVASASNTNATYLLTYLENTCPGFQPNLVVIGDNSGRRAALLAGELDATLVQAEEVVLVEGEAPGRFHALVNLYVQYRQILNQGVFVRQEFGQQHPALVRDYVRAVLLTHRRIIADPEVLYTETATRLDLDPAQARAVGAAYLAASFWDPNGGLTPEGAQATLEFFQANGGLPADLTVDDLVDLSYLDAVLADIGRQ